MRDVVCNRLQLGDRHIPAAVAVAGGAEPGTGYAAVDAYAVRLLG